MSENKNAKTPTDSATGFIDGVWYGPGPTYISNKPLNREWVGLTADEIWKCNKAKSGSAVEFHICCAHQNVLDFAEAIEAKLKEKNGGEYRNGATTERTKLNQENT